jgi:NADPH:quinone reductase
VINRLGERPEVAWRQEPELQPGESLLKILAAPLNPVDVWVSGGRFFGGQPPVPYVPGVEAVGLVVESATHPADSLVFTCLDGLGVGRDGTCAEFAKARDATLVPVPNGSDPVRTAALGTAGLAAWIPLHGAGGVGGDDIVLVLGASGTAGLVAVQVARLLGARRVVAAGRRPKGLERAKAAGADAVVSIEGRANLAVTLREACGESGPTFVFDPLWGEPLVAALEAAAPRARIAHIGQSAGPLASIPSSVVRGKSLVLMGYTTLNVPMDQVNAAYAEMLRAAHDGHVSVDTTTYSLADAPEAWDEQVHGPTSKLVICP